MDDYIKTARRERESCEDFLTANPRQHSCSVQRHPDLTTGLINMNDGDRLTRIETRLVQLMTFLGASPGGRNDPNGFIDNLKGALYGDNPADQTDRSDSPDVAPSPRWSDFDRPAYLRRSGDGVKRTGAATET